MNTSSKEITEPKIVGLTGGIGSGKSTVASIFVSMGVPVFNADDEAKIIINENEQVKQQIIQLFGDVYENGFLNSKLLANKVFDDADALEKLNKIIHPKVKEVFETWINDNSNFPILIKEAAILIESGSYQQLDKIILVTASEELRIERVMKRDEVSEIKVKERMQHQLSDFDKMGYANYIIKNDGHQLLIPQVLEVINQIKKS